MSGAIRPLHAFLKTKQLQPKIHYFLLGIVCVYAICIPVIFFVSISVAAKINIAVTLSGVLTLFVTSIRSVKQGHSPARYYLISQGVVLFSVLFTALCSRGILPLYHIAPDIMKWGSALEMILFSLGLADLVNNEKRLREKAQRESANAQKQLLESQVRVNEQLDALVRQRTEELEQANTRLRDLNVTDELTGLYNRRYLNQVLPTEYKRAFRESTCLSILMLDIDHFKMLNDTYGHQFGDICLAQTGQIIRQQLHRPTDIGIRYGGEEFVVLLPGTGTDSDGASSVAENIRSAIADCLVSDGEQSTKITISIGIATRVPDKHDDHEELLKLADKQLYIAKENGRNRIAKESLNTFD